MGFSSGPTNYVEIFRTLRSIFKHQKHKAVFATLPYCQHIYSGFGILASRIFD